MNESLSLTSSIHIENSTNTFSSSSRIFNVLSTSYTLTSNIIENGSTSSIISQTKSTIASIQSLVDQMNSYRSTKILARIQACDSNMKLNDICEMYSIDNNTSLLIRQSNIEFYTLQHLFDVLVNRIIVQKLNEFCLPIKWCLKNLSESDIYITSDIIQERGRSFCYLEQCHSRLLVYINTCPILSNKNISIPTLKLLSMLCTLYNEQQRWSSTQCIEGIVYFLHILYAFWPQIEKCYDNISAGFDGCTSECQSFNDILNQVKIQCDDYGTFLSRVPALDWYQSINLKEICYRKNISTSHRFIYSVENFFSSSLFWDRFHSKFRFNSNNRRFDNNYEYTQLHNSSFEFETNTEIPNTNSTINQIMNDESQAVSNDRFHPFEYQRLLHTES
ncbi:unnamed protein product [Rotaria sordida]|uniref:Uncharacterized protein n=1 Tax=Rotaria sordida TaxID=392033 RepID=A0A818RIS8_9BILA|nr:unnamed protein product [Rotaria sordida]CAF1347304.1 unnamed protein product [Rotaria sordida]CAF1599975.1 unnamed protein product [Rotaria sordida]CAF3658346.1 unnamed protein product [Rotaria sordida]